jgi:hypothetical protein
VRSGPPKFPRRPLSSSSVNRGNLFLALGISLFLLTY